MAKQIERADFVLCVCSGGYHARFANDDQGIIDGDDEWEADSIRNAIYDAKNSRKFVPVQFADDSTQFIPAALRGLKSFRVNQFDMQDDGFQKLHRYLTIQRGS